MPWGSDVSIEADDEGNILVVGKVLFRRGYTAECSDRQRPYFTLLAQGEPT